MFKRNQAVLVRYEDPRGKGEKWCSPRIAIVKSYRAKDDTVNVRISLYRRSSTMTDWRIPAGAVLKTLDIDYFAAESLMRCLPQPDLEGCPVVKVQKKWDTQYPELAELRNDYGPYESLSEGIDRLRSEGKIAA